MSYIAPDSDIIILDNCPLNPSYEHTIMFSSASAQETYFKSLAKYTLADQSYQRVHKGTMRVQILADNIYSCNYLMFRNTAFGSKWFYAFITNIEYINNVTSEITYQIDVLQTWHFDYSLKMCLVEREHTATDVIGEHILPESVECGEYVANTEGQILKTSSNYGYCGYVALISDTSVASGHYHDGYYSGCNMYLFDGLATEAMETLMDGYINDPDSVVACYTVPIEIVENTSTNGFLVSSNDVYSFTFSGSAITSSASLDGYVPKNKKLYTYPYNYFRIITPDGDSLITRYEFCDNLTPQYEITMSITLPVTVMCRPINYKNCNMATTGESLTLQNYPLIDWNYDAFQAYIAQNAVPTTLGFAGRSLGLMFGVGSANIGSALGGTVGSTGMTPLVSYALQQLQGYYQASIAADPVRGSYSNGNVNIGASHQTFYTNRMSVSAEVAKQIDYYFTRFGYKVNTLKVPNRSARPYYTYVKTVDCCISGSVPADDKAMIEGLYNKGITWWTSGANIGDYSLDNTV